MLTDLMDNDISTAGAPLRYRFLGKLGSGGMAEVFLGIQRGERDFTRLVAIKRLHRDATDNVKVDPVPLFVDEARVVATLNHPHIVKVFDLLPLKKDVLIVMEYVDGETFQHIMAETAKRKERIPLPIICRWVAEAAEALHYAHNAVSLHGAPLRLIHRDIDMRNLMVDQNGHLKVIDFGVAESISRHSEETGDRTFMGKVSYAAPELFVNPDAVDHRIDLYALGLVFYALVTGKKPYPYRQSASTAELINKVIHDPLKSPSTFNADIPAELDALVAKAVHKDPAMRFQCGEALADAVTRFAKDHEGLATSQEVKRWYQTRFKERIALRQTFIQEAMARAKQFIESNTFSSDELEDKSLTPSLTFDPSSSQLSFSDQESNDDNATAVYRYVMPRLFWRRRIVLTGAFVAVTLLLGVVAFIWGTDRRPEAETEVLPSTAIASDPALFDAPIVSAKTMPVRPGLDPTSMTQSEPPKHEHARTDAQTVADTPASTAASSFPMRKRHHKKKRQTRDDTYTMNPSEAAQRGLGGSASRRRNGSVRILSNYDAPESKRSDLGQETATRPKAKLIESYE